LSEQLADPATAAPVEGFPRPVGFSETASIAWALYKSRIGSLFGFTATVYILFSLVQLTLLNLIVLADLDEGPELALTLVPVYVAPAVIASFVFALVSISAARSLVGDPPERPNLGQLAGKRVAIFRLGWISGLVFVAALVIGPAFQLFYPLFFGPAIFIQAIALEPEVRPGRARDLLKGQWGRVGFFLLPVCAVVGVLSLVLPVMAFTGLEPTSPVLAFFAVVLVHGILWAVLLPFVATFQLVCYMDLRARKEELDANHLKAELA
jgi:hypothetical protein